MIDQKLARRHVVLLGIGHTNAHVVRMWRMHGLTDTDLTCISDFPIATYSGMLPAALSGQVDRSDMQIDLVRLCGWAGAKLITDEVTGLDTDQQLVLFESRPPVPFDVLSIGIGSVPTTDGEELHDESLLKIKPMQTFLARLAEAVHQADQVSRERELRVVVVGGGVAGTEVLFCLPAFLREHSARPHSLHLISRGAEIVPEVENSLRRGIEREIRQRELATTLGKSVVRVSDGEVELDDGSIVSADIVVWATGAKAPERTLSLGLPVDEKGFLLTESTLQSISGAPIFAVGDTGSIKDRRVPKSGVHAVRQGKVLWQNIQNVLEKRPLLSYEPQTSFMKLVNLGDQYAIGQWKGISFRGKWVLRLKHWIDNRFMEEYRPPSPDPSEIDPMQCNGCGCKFAAADLDSALCHTFELNQPCDDAAPVGDHGSSSLASTDFFTAPFTDAYLNGRITALHCASDLVACGAEIQQALANVTLCEGDRRTQQRWLSDFLAGARLEFSAAGGSIVGGHTIVGPRTEVGFTVIGRSTGARIEKQNLRVGDELYLTKPLGIGVLLAAHRINACAALDYEAMLQTMLLRQHPFAGLATGLGIAAGTDVTGFGLAGHLLEMLRASNCSAVLELKSIPVLSGAEEAIERGIRSSLGPDNQYVESFVTTSVDRSSARYSLIFDPQTCGGLLVGVAAGNAQAFTEACERAGLERPVRIGEATASVGTVLLTVEA